MNVKSICWTIAGAMMLLLADVAVINEARADTCYRTFWPSTGRVVELQACERGGGSSSGYTTLRNNSRQDLRVCWVLHYGNGEQSRRQCNSRLRAGDERRASCYSCNRQHRGGVTNVTWIRVDPVQ